MQIELNGHETVLDGPITVARLLERCSLHPQRVAVEINEELVRRTEFAERLVEDGDRVEVVTLVGGG